MQSQQESELTRRGEAQDADQRQVLELQRRVQALQEESLESRRAQIALKLENEKLRNAAAAFGAEKQEQERRSADLAGENAALQRGVKVLRGLVEDLRGDLKRQRLAPLVQRLQANSLEESGLAGAQKLGKLIEILNNSVLK